MYFDSGNCCLSRLDAGDTWTYTIDPKTSGISGEGRARKEKAQVTMTSATEMKNIVRACELPQKNGVKKNDREATATPDELASVSAASLIRAIRGCTSVSVPRSSLV